MTLTTERLKWLHDAATELSATKLKMTMRPDELLVLTSELLANREAQPVLYTSEETLVYAKEGEKSLVTWSEPMGDAMIPLFTVPPAPTSGVVNLPTEFISDEGVVVRLEQVMAALALVGVKYERRGDDCRAAMLAQPVSGGYKLPPHLYRELVNSLRDTAVKFSDTEQLRERLNTALSQFIEPDHPHTRTVAPEGGNG
ncbi:hypothetical protein ACGEDE_19820 [Serratia marcescens]|uniref:hypothetical protein n=1 Tax=Serratia marcescens TaxID=615 RepID=UPI002AB45643|nr:hypothetical protein [Serratia marcescens]MDY7607934.1 hypothetical protein [Serratia marcescens]